MLCMFSCDEHIVMCCAQFPCADEFVDFAFIFNEFKQIAFEKINFRDASGLREGEFCFCGNQVCGIANGYWEVIRVGIIRVGDDWYLSARLESDLEEFAFKSVLFFHHIQFGLLNPFTASCYYGERVVKFMSDAGGHLAKQCE